NETSMTVPDTPDNEHPKMQSTKRTEQVIENKGARYMCSEEANFCGRPTARIAFRLPTFDRAVRKRLTQTKTKMSKMNPIPNAPRHKRLHKRLKRLKSQIDKTKHRMTVPDTPDNEHPEMQSTKRTEQV